MREGRRERVRDGGDRGGQRGRGLKRTGRGKERLLSAASCRVCVKGCREGVRAGGIEGGIEEPDDGGRREGGREGEREGGREGGRS